MPPVADEETLWGKTLAEALDRNADRDEGPTSWSGLAKAMADQPDATQTKSSYLSGIKDVRKGRLPSERWAQVCAAALRVERSALPDSSEASRLSTLELSQGLREVLGAIAAQREAIDGLAVRVALLERPAHGHGETHSPDEEREPG